MHKDNARDGLVFADNVSTHLSIDETSLSRGELYTVVTNKQARGKKGTIVAILNGTKSEDIIPVLMKIPARIRNKVQEITLDLAGNMALIAKRCFRNAVQVTSKMLKRYEDYLKTPRTMMRPDQFGKMRPRHSKGGTDGGLHNHMRDLRTLFKDAQAFYNENERGIEIIKHYPFEIYKIVNAPENDKEKLTVEQVKKIRDVIVLTHEEAKAHTKQLKENSNYEQRDLVYVLEDSREHQAAELAMLSFYMCGMNAADLYQLPPADETTIHRLNYNRAKTKDRRKDKAFISLNIPDVAVGLYVKYAGKLQIKYSTREALDQALSRAMKTLGQKLRISQLWFYDLRHAFADQAQNICGFSTENVGKALNHKDNANKMTNKILVKTGRLRMIFNERCSDCTLNKIKLRNFAMQEYFQSKEFH